MKFNKVTQPPISFFDFLPEDWKEELLPQWDNLRSSSEVYTITIDCELICMGIVFKEVLPKLSLAEKRVQKMFVNYSYIGYLYTLPKYRGQGFATKWFEFIKKQDPKRNFWLAIEESILIEFYSKHGFKKYDQSTNNDHAQEELILYYTFE